MERYNFLKVEKNGKIYLQPFLFLIRKLKKNTFV